MKPTNFTMAMQSDAADFDAGVAVVIGGVQDAARQRSRRSSRCGGRRAAVRHSSAAAVRRGCSMRQLRPNFALQPTRAAGPFGASGTRAVRPARLSAKR